MTAELKSLIEQIGAKSQQLHQALVAERARVDSMKDEIDRLNGVISEMENQKKDLQLEVQDLTTTLNRMSEQAPVQQSSNGSNLEIDVLVREIDFCIQQLKIANE